MNNSLITYSASDLKNRSADILNIVYYKKNSVIIEKFGKPIAKIIPFIKEVANKESEKERIKKVLDKYYGIAPDFPDVTKMRYFRKRNIVL